MCQELELKASPNWGVRVSILIDIRIKLNTEIRKLTITTRIIAITLINKNIKYIDKNSSNNNDKYKLSSVEGW